MTKLPTKTSFGLPLQEMVKPMGASAKVARLREAGYRFEAQLRELERQFDAKARKLSEEYVSAVDELNGEG
jgi:hypothetical protein